MSRSRRKFWVIADLIDPTRNSGYKYVGYGGGGEQKKRWAARIPGGPTLKSGTGGIIWRGPRRATPEEAAQDYCNYMNGNPSAAKLPSYPTPRIDMGGTTRHAPKQDVVKVIRKEFKGPHDLYDVLIKTYGDDLVCRKVGITAVDVARYTDICRMLGTSIEAYASAVTYPSKAKAKDAEDSKIAAVCGDPKWERIAKEAFYPTKTKEDSR